MLMSLPDTTIVRRLLSTVTPTDPLDEELLPHFNAKHFYPVHPGEIFSQRYQTIAKLGFGSGSTVWLARDLDLYVSTLFDAVDLLIHVYVVGGHRQSLSLSTLKLMLC